MNHQQSMSLHLDEDEMGWDPSMVRRDHGSSSAAAAIVAR